jgi:hypothetical protein
MVLASIQPLTEMSTRNLPGGKGRPARKADNLTAICESIVYIMLDPQRLTTLWAFTASYRNSFTFLPLPNYPWDAGRHTCILFRHSFIKIGIFRQIVLKLPNVKFHRNKLSSSWVVTCGQKLTDAFLQLIIMYAKNWSNCGDIRAMEKSSKVSNKSR